MQFLSDKQQKDTQGQGDKDTHGRRRRSLEYSEQHYRRLKRQRTSSCAASLEQEGLTPVKVIARNTRTDELETIVLNDSNVREALDVHGEDPG